MRLQNTHFTTWILLSLMVVSAPAFGQSQTYKRKTTTPAATTPATSAIKTDAKSSSGTATTPAQPDSEKLDISELEQKYWAPKDTDFSVVQNRTYTKAKRYAVSYMLGPIVNDPFNDGLNHVLSVNYYMDERMGVEFMFIQSDLSDSDATEKFRSLSGGGVRPDFNRDVAFYGLGFNFVPFYAKMSFMGKKIIYFDMQVTPFLGMTTYEQQSDVKTPEETAFTYGLDITQYFFFSKNFAVRANLHNRFYKADVLAYQGGAVARPNDMTNTSMFLMGLTYFF